MNLEYLRKFGGSLKKPSCEARTPRYVRPARKASRSDNLARESQARMQTGSRNMESLRLGAACELRAPCESVQSNYSPDADSRFCGGRGREREHAGSEGRRSRPPRGSTAHYHVNFLRPSSPRAPTSSQAGAYHPFFDLITFRNGRQHLILPTLLLKFA